MFRLQPFAVNQFCDTDQHVIWQRTNLYVAVPFIEALRLNVEIGAQQEHIARGGPDKVFRCRQEPLPSIRR